MTAITGFDVKITQQRRFENVRVGEHALIPFVFGLAVAGDQRHQLTKIGTCAEHWPLGREQGHTHVIVVAYCLPGIGKTPCNFRIDGIARFRAIKRDGGDVALH